MTSAGQFADGPYVVVGAVLAAGVLTVAGALVTARLLRPRADTPQKLLSYESGVDPVGTGWAQSQIRYYRYAFLYALFAVDAVYLFPWVAVIRRYGWATLAEMGVFLGILAVGLLHAGRRGMLRWQ